MKRRLKEIEEEAGALREMQAKVEKEMGAVQGILLFHLSYSLTCFLSPVLDVVGGFNRESGCVKF